jgi:cytochrome P450
LCIRCRAEQRDIPTDLNEFYGSIISRDDPRHATLRRPVSKTFTPRMLEPHVFGVGDDCVIDVLRHIRPATTSTRSGDAVQACPTQALGLAD